jgi:hypothetical protein
MEVTQCLSGPVDWTRVEGNFDKERGRYFPWRLVVWCAQWSVDQTRFELKFCEEKGNNFPSDWWLGGMVTKKKISAISTINSQFIR